MIPADQSESYAAWMLGLSEYEPMCTLLLKWKYDHMRGTGGR
jgi:hypothetical protein